jgi:hypothetical protein
LTAELPPCHALPEGECRRACITRDNLAEWRPSPCSRRLGRSRRASTCRQRTRIVQQWGEKPPRRPRNWLPARAPSHDTQASSSPPVCSRTPSDPHARPPPNRSALTAAYRTSPPLRNALRCSMEPTRISTGREGQSTRQTRQHTVHPSATMMLLKWATVGPTRTAVNNPTSWSCHSACPLCALGSVPPRVSGDFPQERVGQAQSVVQEW